MLTKTYTGARLKALKDDDGNFTGEVEMYVSMFGNVDKVGDRVNKEAFDETMDEWRKSGDPIPMVWSHEWANPFAHVGTWDAEKSIVDDNGLLLRGKMDIEDNEFARQAFKLVQTRRVREASFGYEILEQAPVKSGPDKGATDLLKLALIEAGPTLKGANDLTRLVSAKSDDTCPTCGQPAVAAEKADPEPEDDEPETTEPEPITAPDVDALRDRVLRLSLGL